MVLKDFKVPFKLVYYNRPLLIRKWTASIMEAKYVNGTDESHKMYFISDIPQTMDKA
jgi:hypothetical protein